MEASREVIVAAPRIQSVRLSFRYDGAGVKLVRRTWRRGLALPGAAVDRELPPGVVVLELRSPAGAVLFRRLLSDPFRQRREVFGHEGGPRQVAYAPEVGGFSVVVPAMSPSTEVVLSVGPKVVLAQSALAPAPGEPPRWRELLRERLGDDDEGGRR
jgi:hypothetical protein